MKPIFVFKTSVETDTEAQRLRPLLNQLLSKGERWNFDLEDCDRILRVESRQHPAALFIQTLQDAGFHCEELPD